MVLGAFGSRMQIGSKPWTLPRHPMYLKEGSSLMVFVGWCWYLGSDYLRAVGCLALYGSAQELNVSVYP